VSSTKEAFDLFCPICNILVEAKVIADGNGGFRNDAVNPLDEIDTEYHGDHYYVCQCGRCNQAFLIRQGIYGVPGEFETITDETVLYPPDSKLPIDGLSTAISTAYEQAAKSFVASLYEPCVLMCRKCLEATCKDLGAAGRDLKERLHALHDAGHIDERLSEWAHGIRLLGNEAAHDTDMVVSKNDARDVLDFTQAILIYVYSLTARFDQFKNRRAKSGE